MKQEFDIEFCYKGNREYVHGTDIFSKLTEHFSNNVNNIDIVFHGITMTNMKFFNEKPHGKNIKVTFKCQDDKGRIIIFGIENNSNIDCRYGYKEETIIDSSTVNVNEETISLNTPTKYSFIEHVVAMNKALLENLFKDLRGKWYFTRLQLKENIQMYDDSVLSLALKSNFQFKLTKSAIIFNGKEVGFIYFSLVLEEH